MTLRLLRIMALAVSCAMPIASSPVQASTDGAPDDWSLNELGGSSSDLRLLQSGTLGVLMASSPAELLFIGWRRLHGLAVGDEAAATLTVPCCGGSHDISDAVAAWLFARNTVPGASALDRIDTERSGPDYTSAPNCLADAFRTAVRTLEDRAEAHGRASAEVRFWLDAQDAVFQACAKPVPALPALSDAAPDWLQADHRYQAAALAFYNADYLAAAAAFATIVGETGSPWQGIAPYLRVRALLRRGMASKEASDFTVAQEAAATIPATAPLHDAAAALGNMAQLRADPAAAVARLNAALTTPELTGRAASDFKDLQSVGTEASSPDFLDWINTLKTGAAVPPVFPNDPGTPLERARAAETRRVEALAHARDREAVAHDPAWLVAVMALTQPDDPDAVAAIAAATALEPSVPAYLTALYHRIRLTVATADPAGTRLLLDSVLARADLSGTTRNLFLAERMLVAANGGEMARMSLRARICAKPAEGCKTRDWGYYSQGPGLFDGPDEVAINGVGDDARYLIDRMALASRVALGNDLALPAPIRLDLALTSFARAVLLRDEATVDALCRQLQLLLPVMMAEFAAIPMSRPGADRQFAEYLVFAKIPGLRVDLLDYTRPTGTVAAFGGTWPNWVVLAKPDATIIPPAPVLYDNATYQTVDVPAGTDLGEGRVRIPDVVCKGICGASGFVPRPPAFLAATASAAMAERHLLPPPGLYSDSGDNTPDRRSAFPDPATADSKPIAAPAGATYVWDFILDYAAKHPQDPRVPEALHWMIHVGHYGQGHNQSGKRAFMLLKSRYPTSHWAKENSFYYD